MRTRILAVVAALILFAMVGGSARADNIAVQNGSFDQLNASGFSFFCGSGCAYNLGPIPNWTMAGYGGSFEPGGAFNTPVPDGGSNIAFITGTLSQDLGVPEIAGDTYTLSVFVGDRLDNTPGTWSIMLDGGSTVLCSNGGVDSSIALGTFAEESCTFTASSTVPSGDLVVWLTGSGFPASFDDVTVTQTPEPNSALLLGAGVLLLAIFGMFYKRKQGLQDAA
ncbi:MAG TPA: hypothetical protein VN885_07090 [Candidatus Acidoferrales bacterium]|nr:hypothetical protein [Candidatus Acidoferrales bacterium]